MAMKRCPVCGEKYSDTYKECPFCEEEEALREGEKLRRSRGGHRASRSRQFSLITPTLIVLILIMAGLLVYLLYGDQLAEKFKKGGETATPPTEDVTPVKPAPTEQEKPDVTEPEPSEEEPGAMPEEDPNAAPGSSTTAPTAPAAQTDYDKMMALPSGLTLSTTDFTLKNVGETATIKVSGGSGSYTWASEDEGVASVDGSGKVTAISRGTINIVVSDGSKKGVCIVRCSISGSAAAAPSGSGTTAASGSGLQAGSAKVINGGNGVRVRSGPGTNYDILATIPNGGSVKIVESAGDGWYKITFSDVGGATATGYMKGEFLANN